MLIFEKIKNFLSLYEIKKNEAIKICLKNNIPLTNKNVEEIKNILKNNQNLKKSD